MSYKDDIQIDKFALDIEWEQHPAKYMKWAEDLAQAIFERDDQKQKNDILEAQLDKKYRKELLAKEGKVTEGMVSAAIKTDEEYIEAINKLNQKNFNVNILTSVRVAMDSKKKALELLTQLFLSSYYSKPVITKESEYRAVNKRREEDSTRLSDKMKDRLRRTKKD